MASVQCRKLYLRVRCIVIELWCLNRDIKIDDEFINYLQNELQYNFNVYQKV